MLTYYLYLAVCLFVAAFLRPQRLLPLFILGVFLFVGFRYETGYDWPVYKEQFDLSRDVPITDIVGASLDIQRTTNQDLGFVILTFLFAQFSPSYEFLQAFVTAFYLYSVLTLSRTLGVRNVALVLAICSCYLLLSFEFSTVRQCLATSMVMLGVSFALRKAWARSFIFFTVPLFIQISSGLYVVAFLFALRSNQKILLSTVGGIVSALALNAVFVTGILTPFLPANLQLKITYYQEYYYGGNALQVLAFHFILSFCTLIYCLHFLLKSEFQDRRSAILARTVVFLSLISFAFIFQTTVLQRISYFQFIAFTLFVSISSLKSFWTNWARSGLVLMGLTYSSSILFGRYALPFTPYQNYVLYSAMEWQSDGLARNDQMIREFNFR
jgi:EpsG family